MPDKTDLLVGNLHESLKRIQAYMLGGLGASMFFALIAFSDLREVIVEAPAVGSTLPVSANLAYALSLSTYWVCGLMATLLVPRANRLVFELAKASPELVEPALLYPSIVTLRVYGPRIGLSLLPPLILISSAIQVWGGKLLSASSIFGLAFLVLPFITLSLQLKRSIGGYKPSEWGD